MDRALLFETEIGTCGLSWNDRGLTATQLPEATADHAAARITRHGAVLLDEANSPPHIRTCVTLMRSFVSGEPTTFEDVALDMRRHPDFEQAVYQNLRNVPWGETVSYGHLARSVDRPDAAQAVGTAMGRNSWPVIVPCHRVLTSDGKLGGFSAYGGGETKAALLAQEGVHFDHGQMDLFA